MRPWDPWLVRVLIGAALALLAIGAVLRACPFLAVIACFGAGHFVASAGVEVRDPRVILLGALLWLPPAVLGVASCRSRPAALLALSILALLGGALAIPSAAALDGGQLAPRAVVLDRWRSAHPLRVVRPASQGFGLHPEPMRARCLDWQGEWLFEVPPFGEDQAFDLEISNLGPVEGLAVVQGAGSFVPGPRGTTRLHLGFGGSATSFRAVFPPWTRRTTRVLLVGGLFGDSQLLGEFLDRAAAVDVVLLLGDLVRPGHYDDAVAMLDVLDRRRLRCLGVPGDAESRTPGTPVLFGPAERVARGGGVDFVLVDLVARETRAGSGGDSGLEALGLFASRRGSTVVAVARPLEVPEDGSVRRIAVEPERTRLAASLRGWRTSLVLSATEGTGFDFVRDGLRHLAIGNEVGRPEACVLELDQDGRVVGGPERLRAGHAPDATSAAVWFHRRCAMAAEHLDHGERLAYGLAAIMAAALGAAGVALRARRGDHES